MPPDIEQKHLREAARLLTLCVELDTLDEPDDEKIEQYSIDLSRWLSAEETRQKEGICE